MERFHATYEEPHDFALVKKMNAALIRANWHAWYEFGLKWAGFCLLICLTTWLISSYYAQKYVAEGLWLSAAFAIIVGLLFPVIRYLQLIYGNEPDPYEGEVWQNTMNDERWSSRAKNGLILSVPWELMKVRYEHPEGWAVECYNHNLWVLREPLRKAGLEEEFKNRMGKKPVETT